MTHTYLENRPQKHVDSMLCSVIFLAVWSWPSSGEWPYSDSRGGHLFTAQQSTGGPVVVMRRVGTEEASRYYPASNARLEADPVPLGSAEWWLEGGYWPPKPVKWNISRHRGRQEGKRVGSVAACHQLSTSRPPCNPTLCHPVGEG